MAKVYHKLVRDKIPQIIQSTGKTCTLRKLDREAYLQMLDRKLDEELEEFRQSGEAEELADLMEVIAALGAAKGYSWEQLLQLRQEKRQRRGGFDEQLLLLEVSD